MELDSRFAEVLAMWRAPKGRMHGMGWTLEYRAFTMNASGRDDTSLANALLNGAVMFLSLVCSYYDIGAEQITVKQLLHVKSWIMLSVSGDDSLAIAPYLPVEPEVFARRLSVNLGIFGFDADEKKLKISDKPFDMVYLAMRPHPFQGKWYFAKTVGRALWKLGWRLDFESGDQEAWMAGNMYQVSTSQAIVPVLSDIAEAYLNYHGSRTVRQFEPDPNRPWEWGVSTPRYDDGVINYLADGYQIDPGELLACCLYVSSIVRFPCVLDHPVITRFMVVDEM
jgi:hypothetical protein